MSRKNGLFGVTIESKEALALISSSVVSESWIWRSDFLLLVGLSGSTLGVGELLDCLVWVDLDLGACSLLGEDEECLESFPGACSLLGEDEECFESFPGACNYLIIQLFNYLII